MFVTPAQAAEPSTSLIGPDIISFLPLILIFVVFYFLLIRPQQKKMREHQKILAALKRGDKIVTGGGIIGIITKVGTDDDLQVEIADGVKVKVQRSTVAGLIAHTDGTPVKGSEKSSDAASKL